jgi:hypothetical protein
MALRQFTVGEQHFFAGTEDRKGCSYTSIAGHCQLGLTFDFQSDFQKERTKRYGYQL